MQGNYFANGISNSYGPSPIIRSNTNNLSPYIVSDPYRNYGSSPYNYSSNYGITPLSYSRLPNISSDHEEHKADPSFNQYSNSHQEQVSSPHINKSKKLKTNTIPPIRPNNLGFQNKPVFNAFVLNQSQTPKPKSTVDKNKSSNPTFTLASNNILSNGNGYHSHNYSNIENINSNTNQIKNSSYTMNHSHPEINSNNYHPLILNNQMTSNRNNYLSSQTDTESIRTVNNPVLSSSSDQNRIIGNLTSTRRRDPIETQFTQNTQSSQNRITTHNNTGRTTTTTRNYNQGQFNTNTDYINNVIAQSLQELNNDDSLFEDIEIDRTNRNGLTRANSNTTTFGNNYNYGLNTLPLQNFGMNINTISNSNSNNTNSNSNNNGNQQIRYAPAYEYLPRLGNLSDIIPINSQTGRFYLGRDRNMNILRGRITLGDDGGITVSLSDMNRGGETIQTFSNFNALAAMGGLDAIVTRILGDNLEQVEWLADFFESLFSHFTEGQQQQLLEKKKSNGLSEEEIDKIPIVEYKKPTKKNKKKDETSESLCYICLMDYEDKDRLRELPCKHKFHTECLDPWLKSKNECPTCRAKINE